MSWFGLSRPNHLLHNGVSATRCVLRSSRGFPDEPETDHIVRQHAIVAAM